ncbi:MAG: hypothetical protein WKG06_30050 [Segetibacter sp.]
MIVTRLKSKSLILLFSFWQQSIVSSENLFDRLEGFGEILIKFDKENKENILLHSCNLFESGYEEYGYFKTEKASDIINNLSLSKFFKEKYKTYVINTIVFLTHVDLDETEFNQVGSRILKLIKVEDFFHHLDYKPIFTFLSKNYKYFTSEEIRSLIDVSTTKRTWFKDYEFMNFLSTCINNRPKLSIKDADISKKLFESINYDPTINNNISWPSLYSITENSFKEDLKVEIKNALEQQFNNDLYYYSLLYNVIDANEYTTKALQYLLNKTDGKIFYQIHNNKPQTKSNEIENFAYCVHEFNVNLAREDFEILKQFDIVSKFLILPEKFNYEEFKIEWIYYLYKNNSFLKKISKIPKLLAIIQNELLLNYQEDLALIYSKIILFQTSESFRPSADLTVPTF